MGKFFKILPLLAVLFCLPGSLRREQTPVLPVAERMDVLCRQGSVEQQRHYTSPKKIAVVLNYFRMQKNLGPASSDPLYPSGDIYIVKVQMRDGGQHIYQQRSDRYYSRDHRPWQLIDPDHGCGLYFLLQTLPSD